MFPDDLKTFFIAEPLIQKYEGYSATPYLCQAGRPTIGWGSTRYADGRKVKMTDQAIDPSFAGILLTAAMRRVREDLEPLVKRDATAHQAAALISLAYNIG